MVQMLDTPVIHSTALITLCALLVVGLFVFIANESSSCPYSASACFADASTTNPRRPDFPEETARGLHETPPRHSLRLLLSKNGTQPHILPHSTLDFAPAVPLDAPPTVCVWRTHTATVTHAPRHIDCGAACVTPSSARGAIPVAIHAAGGLANRIIELLSFLAIARRDHRPLIVLWQSTPECPASLTDLFEPLPGDVHVIRRKSQAPANLTASFGYPHPDFDMALLGPMALALLRPQPQAATVIHDVLRKLGSAFSAAHMRRTDLPHTSGRAGELLDAAVAAWACNDSRPLFVSADQPRSLEVILRALPPAQVHSQLPRQLARRKPGGADDALRMTPVTAALVDLWVCSHAARFVGTPGSTFSVVVEALRIARGLPPGSGARAPANTASELTINLPRAWHYPVAAAATGSGTPSNKHD